MISPPFFKLLHIAPGKACDLLVTSTFWKILDNKHYARQYLKEIKFINHHTAASEWSSQTEIPRELQE